MDKPMHYYFCLSVIDALDQETRRTARGPARLGDELRTLMYATMSATATEDNGMTVRHKVDEYFGEGEAIRLVDMVNVLWGVANTHMRERATNGPYTFEPWEFDEVLGIESTPGSDSRTRIWYMPRAHGR